LYFAGYLAVTLPGRVQSKVTGQTDADAPRLIERLAALIPPPRRHRHRYYGVLVTGDGAIAQGPDAIGVGRQSVVIKGDNFSPINTGVQITAADGGQAVHIGSVGTLVMPGSPIPTTSAVRQNTLVHYLQHLLRQNRYLQLQGIRSGGKQVNIELDRIYITLRATHQRALPPLCFANFPIPYDSAQLNPLS
jgi:hypothetical protein